MDLRKLNITIPEEKLMVIEKKRKEMNWAAMASKELRNKSTGFAGGKKASHVIREFRDREK